MKTTPVSALLSPVRMRRPKELCYSFTKSSVDSRNNFFTFSPSHSELSHLDLDSDYLLSPMTPTTRPRSHSESRMADVAYDCYLSKSCVHFLNKPSVLNLCRLRKKLGSSDKSWMEDFLEHHGLELLFECLGTLSKQHNGGFHLLVLRMECVLCLRTCVNSRIGLECLISSGTYGPKLGLGIYPSVCLFALLFVCLSCCLSILPDCVSLSHSPRCIHFHSSICL